MQSSQRIATPMASAMSSFVLPSSAFGRQRGLGDGRELLHHLGRAKAKIAQSRAELFRHFGPIRVGHVSSPVR
jgi:hypothetical protein